MAKGRKRRKPGWPPRARKDSPGRSPADVTAARKEYRRGLKLARQGRVPEAIAKFQAAIKLHRRLPEVHYELGLLYQQEGQSGKALEAYQAELALNPRHDAALNNMGVIHATNGNLLEAIPLLRRALEVNRRNSLAQENLDKALQQKEKRTNQVLKFSAAPLAGPTPSISLCMIVKDEEKHLGGCLATVKDLVNEMVIVDTGSQDRTVEIAESFGARVYHFPWQNDFALARNESLRHASGEWILWLDADFIIPEEEAARIAQAAASGAADAYFINIRSPLPADQLGQNEITLLPLLFRNHRGIRFRGAVHEELMTSLLAANMPPARADVLVEHLGYRTSRSRKEKAARNLQMLQQRLEESPQDPLLFFNIAQCHSILGEVNEATTWLLKTISSPQAGRSTRSNAYASLIGVHLKREDYPGAVTAAQEAVRLFPGHRFIRFLAAVVHRDAGHYGEALKHFVEAQRLKVALGEGDHLLEVSDEALHTMMVQCYVELAKEHLEQRHPEDAAKALQDGIKECGEEVALLNALGSTYFAIGENEEAIAQFSQALRLAPEERGVRGNLVVALKKAGLISEAIWQGLPLLDGEPSDEELRLMAKLYLEVGKLDKAIQFYTRLACSQQAEAADHLELARLRAQAGDVEGAIESTLDALALVPRDAGVWHELGKLYIQAGVPELAREALLQAQELESTSSAINAHLGRLLLSQRAIGEAIPHLERSVELDPSSPDSLKALAAAYREVGRGEDALLLWRHAESLAPVAPP